MFDHPLLSFHLKHLVKLLESKPELGDAVQLLKYSLEFANMGANPKMIEWHLQRVKSMVPDNVEVADAVTMLCECISVLSRNSPL
jgi:hypothetical protein